MFMRQDNGCLLQLLLLVFCKTWAHAPSPLPQALWQANRGEAAVTGLTSIHAKRSARLHHQAPVPVELGGRDAKRTARARLLRPGVEEADLALDVLGARQAQQRAGVAQAQQLQEARLQVMHAHCASNPLRRDVKLSE